MLQPRQLREVSEQYPEQIAEVRDFLNKAGVVVEAPDAIRVIAARLTQDRAFHRDLTSNIWVVLDRSRQQISYSDLLGVVAVAAAGMQHASAAEEDAAHDLLRFLMQARHSLEVFSSPQAPPARQAASVQRSPVQSPVKPAGALPPTPLASFPQADPVTQRQIVAPLSAPLATPIAGRRTSSFSAALAAASGESFATTPEVQTPVLPEESSPVVSPVAEAVAAEPVLTLTTEDPEALLSQPALKRPAATESHVPVPEESVAASDEDKSRSRFAWAAAFACIAALAGGAWRLHNNTASDSSAGHPAPVVDGTGTFSAPLPSSSPEGNAADPEATRLAVGPVVPSHDLQPGYSRGEIAHKPSPAANSAGLYGSRTAAPSTQTTKPSPYTATAPADRASVSGPSAVQPATPGYGNATSSGPAGTFVNAAPIVRTAPKTNGYVIVPASTLSRRLDSPTIPADSLAQNQLTADGRKYPRLLRRKSGSQAFSDEGGELVASVRPPDASLSSIRSGKPSPTQPATPQGIVRPTALGMMASNVLYSPAPAYPAAASAAHVQGQVKIQAQVDRDGNVAWARVVSGPPMLRDAALDAVQHWRYKPYMAGGKPAPTGASAVLDFELP